MPDIERSAGGTADREQEQAKRSGSNPTTGVASTQDRNSPLLTRAMFPKLTDEQWRECRAALRRYARLNQLKLCEQQRPDKPRDTTRPSAVILDYFKTPRRRRRD